MKQADPEFEALLREEEAIELEADIARVEEQIETLSHKLELMRSKQRIQGNYIYIETILRSALRQDTFPDNLISFHRSNVQRILDLIHEMRMP
jgi:hypothetical protein